MSERLNSNLARKGKKPFLVEIHAQIVDSLSVKQKESKSTNTFVRDYYAIVSPCGIKVSPEQQILSTFSMSFLRQWGLNRQF